MMICLLFSGKSTWMKDSLEHISFSESCVFVDLPPKRSLQTTNTPAPSVSIQAPIESEDNNHKDAGDILLEISVVIYASVQESVMVYNSANSMLAGYDNLHFSGISTPMLPSSYEAQEAHQSSVTSDSILNVGKLSNSSQMNKIGSKDDSKVNTGDILLLNL